MSLFSTHSADNRAVSAALSVQYYKRLISGSWVGEALVGGVVVDSYSLMHEYHRVARKSYKYVGMTEAAAKTCAEAMRAIYTRTVKYQQWEATASESSHQGTWITLGVTSTEMSAEIVPRHVGGDMWEVSVDVNEDSVYLSRADIPRNNATIFQAERQRSYDGETEV